MNQTSVTLSEAQFPAELSIVRGLFREYADSLEIDLCFQGFERELAELPGFYARPAGRLFLARSDGGVAGCAALRPLQPGVCEMKRLYVRPAFRGRGCGRVLAQATIQAGRLIGYDRMRLDTLASMSEALALYTALGFRRTAPYYENPNPSVVFMELALRQETTGQPGAIS